MDDLNNFLSEYPYDVLTEENLIKHVRDYMSKFVDLDDFKDYKYCPKTGGWKIWEAGGAAGYEADSIIISPDINEDPHIEVTSYTISYNKFVNGVRTEDRIECRCDANGNITGFFCYQYKFNVDLHKFELVNIQKNIESFLKNESEYSVIDWEMKDIKIIYVGNKATLLATILANVVFTDSSKAFNIDMKIYLS